MARSKATFPMYRAVHPGEILREELKERHISQSELSRQTGIAASHINEFIKGKRSLSRQMADAFEAALGISALSLMSMQIGYDSDRRILEERQREKYRNMNPSSLVAGYFPVDTQPLVLHDVAVDKAIDNDGMRVARLILYALEKKGMSQKELAMNLGITPSRVNDFISGKAEPKLSLAAKICTLLEISASDMLGL